MCWTVSCWAKMAMVTLVFGVTLHTVGWPYMKWMAYKTSGSVLEMLERVAGLWNQKSWNNIMDIVRIIAATFNIFLLVIFFLPMNLECRMAIAAFVLLCLVLQSV